MYVCMAACLATAIQLKMLVGKSEIESFPYALFFRYLIVDSFFAAVFIVVHLFNSIGLLYFLIFAQSVGKTSSNSSEKKNYANNTHTSYTHMAF